MEQGVSQNIEKIQRNDYFRLAKLLHLRGEQRVGYDKPLLPMDHRGAFLFPEDRVLLRRTLDRRCEKMLAQGLLIEAMRYMHKYKNAKVPIIGYREAVQFIELDNPTHEDFRQFLLNFQAATNRYAKRQMTWFRNE